MDAIQGGISAHSFLFTLTIGCLGLLLDRCETSNWWLSQEKLQFLSALIPAWWPVATTLICLFPFLFSIFLCHCCWHGSSHCLWLFKILVYLLSVVTTWMVQGLQVSSILYSDWFCVVIRYVFENDLVFFVSKVSYLYRFPGFMALRQEGIFLWGLEQDFTHFHFWCL